MSLAARSVLLTPAHLHAAKGKVPFTHPRPSHGVVL